MKAYRELEKIFKKIDDINGAKAVLHWDSAVMMPNHGATIRAEQLATLETLTHTMITAPQVADLLGQAETETDQYGAWQTANIKEMRRLWQHSNALPESLVARFTKEGAECEMVWREARQANDFKRFAPYLQNVLTTVKEIAKIKGEALNVSPYDALIDQYDPGTTMADIDIVFDQLKDFLPDFIGEVIEQQNIHPEIRPLTGHFPIEKQKALGITCMQAIGFDFNHGRIDISHHPFCGGVAGDVRLTTRYDEADFTSALMGVLHETGHAMYENQLPAAWRAQPVGKARGMAMHESQSLLVEMQACRSLEFLTFVQPHIQAHFNVSGDAWSVENLYRAYTHVERSLIRVDADEVTYPAHVMMRYELEKALLSGDLSVNDLPLAWEENMRRYLGITPDNDQNGCMQDIHWTDGSFGYFPSYTLGAIIAAQLYAQAKTDKPNIPAQIQQGNFSELMTWLLENVHSKASRLRTSEILHEATGRDIDVAHYIQHLKTRYLN